jgi:hypothetical protein
MSLFNERSLTLGDPRLLEVLEVVYKGYAHYNDKDQIEIFVEKIGIPSRAIDWDGSLNDVWPRILLEASRCTLLRKLVEALRDDANYAKVRPQIEAIISKADDEEREEAKSKAGAADHAGVTIVGRRPFVNRSMFRDNLRSLFGPDGDRSMIVDGPRKSGRSYSWVLIQYVSLMTGMQANLIDISTFGGARAKPDDVAKMIAADLNWPSPEQDPNPDTQDDTRGRLLLGWLKSGVRLRGPVHLVFDGLDGDNLSREAVDFIGDIAAAAGNDELGESRVILLAYGRALRNPNVDPIVLREPPLADIPLVDFTGYLRAVAKEGGQAMDEARAIKVVERLFGPPPDPVPVSLLAARARELSGAVCKLRRGIDG